MSEDDNPYNWEWGSGSDIAGSDGEDDYYGDDSYYQDRPVAHADAVGIEYGAGERTSKREDVFLDKFTAAANYVSQSLPDSLIDGLRGIDPFLLNPAALTAAYYCLRYTDGPRGTRSVDASDGPYTHDPEKLNQVASNYVAGKYGEKIKHNPELKTVLLDRCKMDLLRYIKFWLQHFKLCKPSIDVSTNILTEDKCGSSKKSSKKKKKAKKDKKPSKTSRKKNSKRK
jgi:hypothetical protein